MILWALLPFITLLLLLVIFRLPAKYAMPITWALTLALVMGIWKVVGTPLLQATSKALITTIDILLILLFAIWLLEILKESKGIESMKKLLKSISPNKAVQVLLIAWLFGALLEGAAGFGTPAAIVAPILVSLGFKPVRSVIIALIANSTPVSFGAVGTPIVIGLGSIGLASSQVTIYTALLHGIVGIFVPVLVALLVQKEWKSVWIGLWAGICFLIPYVSAAFLIGPELPSIIGSMIGLLVFGSSMHYLMPGKVKMKKEVFVFLPYLILVILLIGRALFKQYLQFQIGPFTPLYSPWFYLALALLSAIFLRHVNVNHVSIAGKRAFTTMNKAIIPLFFALGTVQLILITQQSNLQSIPSIIASQLVHAGTFYPLVSPFLGAMGSFMTGSNTVSNLLFAPFQAETAIALGLSLPLILALQTVGGAVGNMIAVHNVVAACTTVNASGKEGEVMRATILPCLVYAFLVGVIGLLLASFI